MKSRIRTIALALLAAACTRGSEPDTKKLAATDSAKAPVHDMSAMPDTTPDTSAMGEMAQMGEMQHGQMAGMRDVNTKQGGGGGSMGGMDHSKMQQNTAVRGQPSMPGMNHPKMSRNAPGTKQQPMAGMDHPAMNMHPATGGSMQMQHQMPMHEMRPGQANPPAGMQMPPPEQLAAPDDAAMEKLRAIVAELLRDPKILARIEADTALKRRWQDPRIQQYLMKRP